MTELQQQDDINRESIIRLSRKFSSIHADLELRRYSLKDADYKFTHMKNYLTDCQMWLAGAEKLLESEKKLENLKVRVLFFLWLLPRTLLSVFIVM